MDDDDEAIKRIRDLRRRIEELRNTLHPTQRVQQRRSVAEDKPVVDETETKRNADLEDLKRKLMKGK